MGKRFEQPFFRASKRLFRIKLPKRSTANGLRIERFPYFQPLCKTFEKFVRY